MAFNEDSRVKIPALLHLTRLGFSYLSLKDLTWDESTNIFPTLFRDSIRKINPGASSDDIDRLLQDIKDKKLLFTPRHEFFSLDAGALTCPIPKACAERCAAACKGRYGTGRTRPI